MIIDQAEYKRKWPNFRAINDYIDDVFCCLAMKNKIKTRIIHNFFKKCERRAKKCSSSKIHPVKTWRCNSSDIIPRNLMNIIPKRIFHRSREKVDYDFGLSLFWNNSKKWKFLVLFWPLLRLKRIARGHQNQNGLREKRRRIYSGTDKKKKTHS